MRDESGGKSKVDSGIDGAGPFEENKHSINLFEKETMVNMGSDDDGTNY